MYKINLLEKFKEKLIWGHTKGREYREIILSEWKESMDNVLAIDFKDISLIDYSAASDIICIPISRIQLEFEGKHIFICNATNEVRENINITLERQELCCLNILDNKEYELLGKYSEGLKSIIDELYRNRKMDSRMLADNLNTTVQVINNRTTTLNKLGLVKRNTEDAPTGGKQYIYESII